MYYDNTILMIDFKQNIIFGSQLWKINSNESSLQ